jgi:intracellular multiplication protein IcmJ
MYPLQLSVNPEGWRLYIARKADKAFLPLRDKVFKRDQSVCQFCGFQAQAYQEVINLDNDYRHNKLSNLATACCFCTQCLFFESVGQGGYGGGKLIYLPEMTQVELNSFCHVIFCAMMNGTNYQQMAENIYRSLRFRSQPIEDKYGIGMSNPNVFGQVLIESEAVGRKQLMQDVLLHLRLLPSYTKFRKQLSRWASLAAEELLPKKIVTI